MTCSPLMTLVRPPSSTENSPEWTFVSPPSKKLDYHLAVPSGKKTTLFSGKGGSQNSHGNMEWFLLFRTPCSAPSNPHRWYGAHPYTSS
ncbi:hypothetical protein DPMN_077432 [Dreissena polymorpha]|uniref:Uncharacterized protein n=1 Tax=Dreissena polymorpha TaxID=45954 RepID=A0A9D3YNI5_DREPO|nr:hypothetical protein DPMN_077432 [Dreissena polymorpha]